MGAYRTCLALVFTASLACDAGVNPPDRPYPTSSSGEVEPQTTPDPVVSQDLDSAEPDTVLPTIPLNADDEFCMPFEMDACHGTTGRMLIDCAASDCMCQLKVMHVKYAQATADCLSLACPKHYPDPNLLASCYQDWFLSIEECVGSATCSAWTTACPETSASHRLQFLRSCLGH